MAISRRQTLSIDWNAAIWSGIFAGFVFLVAEMGLVALMGKSPWGPPRMMAAIVMGEGVLPPPATFDAMIVVVAMLVHFALSILLAALFALLAGGLSMTIALGAGALFGLIIYAVNFYGFTEIFPWFEKARNMVTIVSHVVFGVALGWSFKALQKA